MSTVNNRQFDLKRSYLLIAFQILVYFVISAILFQILTFIWWLLCCFALILIHVFTFKYHQVSALVHLDQDDWSLFFGKSQQVKTVQLKQIIDHQIYIAIYFEQKADSPLVIWRDQLSLKQWKNLKVLAKMK